MSKETPSSKRFAVEKGEASYKRFADEMNEFYPSYDWDSHEVTTEDGYILTMFQIWNSKKWDKSKGPILFQHGMTMDGVDWITDSDDPSAHIYLADQGYDIYVGNGRGSEYSMKHTTLDALDLEDEEAYWNFTFDDMQYDVLAQVKFMVKNAYDVKGYYFGYSEGSTSVQIALMNHSDELNELLNRVILLTPCTAEYEDGQNPDDVIGDMEAVGLAQSLGVYAFNGPHWDYDVNLLCDSGKYSDDECGWFKDYDGTETAVGAKNNDHWTQNSLAQRFQPYMDDWSYPDNIETTLYDYSGITMPISLFVGSKDKQCAPERAYELGRKLQNLQNLYTFKGADHGLGMFNGEKFYKLMAAECTSETGHRETLKGWKSYAEDLSLISTIDEDVQDSSNGNLDVTLAACGVLSFALIGYCVFARRGAKKSTDDFQRA